MTSLPPTPLFFVLLIFCISDRCYVAIIPPHRFYLSTLPTSPPSRARRPLLILLSIPTSQSRHYPFSSSLNPSVPAKMCYCLRSIHPSMALGAVTMKMKGKRSCFKLEMIAVDWRCDQPTICHRCLIESELLMAASLFSEHSTAIVSTSHFFELLAFTMSNFPFFRFFFFYIYTHYQKSLGFA